MKATPRNTMLQAKEDLAPTHLNDLYKLYKEIILRMPKNVGFLGFR